MLQLPVWGGGMAENCCGVAGLGGRGSPCGSNGFTWLWPNKLSSIRSCGDLWPNKRSNICSSDDVCSLCLSIPDWRFISSWWKSSEKIPKAWSIVLVKGPRKYDVSFLWKRPELPISLSSRGPRRTLSSESQFQVAWNFNFKLTVGKDKVLPGPYRCWIKR